MDTASFFRRAAYFIREHSVAQAENSPWINWTRLLQIRWLGARGRALGLVTKRWVGVGRTVFKIIGNYLISLAGRGTAQPAAQPRAPHSSVSAIRRASPAVAHSYLLAITHG